MMIGARDTASDGATPPDVIAATTEELSSIGSSTDGVGGGVVVATIESTELRTDGTLTGTAIPVVDHELAAFAGIELGKGELDNSEKELSEPRDGILKTRPPDSGMLVTVDSDVPEAVEVEVGGDEAKLLLDNRRVNNDELEDSTEVVTASLASELEDIDINTVAVDGGGALGCIAILSALMMSAA